MWAPTTANSTQPTTTQGNSMDPLSVGLTVGGNILAGIGQGKAQAAATRLNKEQGREQARLNWQQLGQADRQYGQNANMARAQYLDQRGVAAADLQKRLGLAPLADRAAYMLAARAGAAPAAFQARDFTRGGEPGAGAATGGYAPMLNAQAQAAQNYTAGAGGLQTDALEAALARLRSMAGVPAEYEAREGGRMALDSKIDEQRLFMANETKAGELRKYQNRLNRYDMLRRGEPLPVPTGPVVSATTPGGLWK